MRSLIFAGALLISSSPVLATECDVEIDGNITFENQVLSIVTNNETKIVINNNYDLFIDDNKVDTNAEQKQWISNYYDGIHAAIPEAANIASEAIELASDSLNQAFDRLLGEKSEVLDNLNKSIDRISQGIRYNFYAEDGTIRFRSTDSHGESAFNSEWEQQFEQELEEVVTQSIGSIMMILGSQLMLSGGDMEAFEKKMEQFGDEIEQSVTKRSDNIERKANAFCARLTQIDAAELKLQKQIKGLEDLNILQLKSSKS